MSMTSVIDDDKDVLTPLKNEILNKNLGQAEGSQCLLKSISSCESPTVRFSTKSKSNE